MTCGCHSHNGLLLAKGLAETVRRSDYVPEVDDRQLSLYLDSRGSVSGARRDESMMIFHEETIDEQYRRFLELDEGECS